MPPKTKFALLYDRVLADEDFRQQLADDPVSALESLGIDPTPQVVSAVQQINASVKAINIGVDAGVVDSSRAT